MRHRLLALLIAWPLAPAAETPLTLAAAIAQAERANETSAIAAQRLARAQGLLREARGALLPALTVGGQYLLRDEPAGRNGDGADRDSAAAEIALDQPLYDPIAWPRLGVVRAQVASERLDARESRRLLAHQVAELFYAVLAAEAQAQAAERRLAVSIDALTEARARRAAGLAASNDVTRSELETATARLAATTRAATVRTTRLALGQTLNAPATAPLVDEPYRVELGGSDQERADLAAIEARVAVARAATVEPRREALPRVSVRGASDLATDEGADGDTADWSVALRLDWILYDGSRYGRVAQRDAEARIAALEAERERRRITTQAAIAEADVLSGDAAVAQAEEGVRVARANHAEVRARFAQGLATALEQADAAASLFEAESDLARQRFARSLAHLRLAAALGRWPLEPMP